MKIIKRLEKLNKLTLITGGLVLLCMVGVLDYYTGYELSFSLFYVIPIAILAWATNGKTGIAISFISAGVWLAADVKSGAQYSNESIYFWNTLVRFGFFLLTTLLVKVVKDWEFEKTIARTDYLTSAVNSRFFSEVMQMEIERSKRYQHPLTLVFLDVDNFKAINDNFGHSLGDKVLITAARAMQENLRKTDIVARVGGDEFAILLPETNMNAARIAVSKMKRGLLNEMHSNHWTITFSVGVVTFLAPPDSADKAMNIADKLMYSVKNSGKNDVCYEIYPNKLNFNSNANQ